MRKRIVAVILALGMTVSLVSCGERGSDPANSLEEVNVHYLKGIEVERVTISFEV